MIRANLAQSGFRGVRLPDWSWLRTFIGFGSGYMSMFRHCPFHSIQSAKSSASGFRRRCAATAVRIGPVPALLCPLDISD